VCTALIPTPANGLLQAINANRGLRELDQAMEIFFQKVPKEGNENNRLVFYYQISKSDENSLFIKMVFLNGINVFAYYK
jgi:hypothetical protein